MTNEVEGIYRRLLDYAWLEDGLPAALEAIFPLCKLGPLTPDSQAQFDRIWPTLAPLFPVGPGGKRRNRRQEKERRKQRKNSKVRQLAAAARWGKEHALCNAFARQMLCLPIAFATADPDQDQQDHRPRPARMTLSIWNVRKHLYAATHQALDSGHPYVDPRGAVNVGELLEHLKTVASKLGATWDHGRELTAILDGAAASWSRKQETAASRHLLERADRRAMGRRVR